MKYSEAFAHILALWVATAKFPQVPLPMSEADAAVVSKETARMVLADESISLKALFLAATSLDDTRAEVLN